MKFRHVSPNVSRTLLTHLKGQPQGSDPSSQRTFPQQPAAIPETFHSQRDALCPSCSAKAHAGIARRAGRSPSEARKLPEQKPRSPRHVSETGKPLRANPWEWGYIRQAQAGSSGGSADGGLGGAAAPNRPRLAARRAGGQNKRKKKAPMPAGHNTRLSEDRPFFTFFRAHAAHTHALPRNLDNAKGRAVP